MELAPGTVILGKYRVEEVLGVGGMGRVVRASHLYLQQAFAIKILLPSMIENPSTVARFLREAQATSRLKSEHIARVLDVGTMPDGAPFMVMEYLAGNDLNQILRHHGAQLPGVVCDLMLQACEGLAEAHALGFVHRDIKPSNFFVTQRPDGSMLLKILDFGISKTPIGYDDLTGTQTIIGTPSYMAPEQMKSVRSADHRSDIWSLGVVMYQLIEGRQPFTGESYAELVIKVGMEPPSPILAPLPPGLAEIILRCLDKNPSTRQQDVGELARMLAPYASDPIIGAQIAVRTTRTLQQRPSQGLGQHVLPTAAGGGLVTPSPLTPVPMSPRTWPPTNTSTSISQGKGQVTYQTNRNRSWIVAGALSVAILAGAAGYIVSEVMRAGENPTTAASNQPVVPAATTPPAPTPTDTKPVDTEPADTKPVDTKPADTKPVDIDVVDTKSADTKSVDTTSKTTSTAKTTTAKTTTAKTTAAKTAIAKPATAKPATAKTATTKATTKSTTKKSGNLFDSRH
ncbi:MAG: serine/threonine-protein kinase [Kofleriaceae bacterium]|nr:serine/threonine-protein kinase [Kofleriaceae bacterium]